MKKILLLSTLVLTVLFTKPLLAQEAAQLNAEIQAVQTSIMSNPELMAEIQTLVADPEISQIIADPNLMQAVMAKDVKAIENNPKAQALIENPKMQRLMQKIQESQVIPSATAETSEEESK